MPEAPSTRTPTSFDPLRSANFRRLWGANLAVSLASLMQQTAAAWVMAELTNSPFQVGLVQTAATLPGVILSLPGGVLGDLVDRRRLMLVVLTPMLLATLAVTVLTGSARITPASLLLVTLVAGCGIALIGPVMHTCQVESVPPAQIPLALPLTATTYNAARAVGPAIAGTVLAVFGATVVFASCAAGYAASLVALVSWHAPARTTTALPESLLAGMRGAWQFARHSDALRLQVLRTVLFIGAASSLLALLPFVARDLMSLDADGFGLLLGVFGLGAVLGAGLIGVTRRAFGLNGSTELAAATFALSLLALAATPGRVASILAVLTCGATWMLVGNTHVTALQTAIPGWVRSRAMAIYMLAFQGCIALGGAVWGAAASFFGTRIALTIAGVTTLGVALAMRFRRVGLGELDQFAPAAPLELPLMPARDGAEEAIPVVVEIDYRVSPERREAFVAAVSELGVARRRNGAHRWRLLHDLADGLRYSERFMVDSWPGYLRHESRATVADRDLERRVAHFHLGPEPPARRHYMAILPGS